MRIVIAPDSFKESLSAPDVAVAMAAGVRAALPDADCHCLPMADGGEGTVEALVAATGGQRQCQPASGPDGKPRDASWGWLGDDTAVIEVAEAAGLALIPADQRQPLTASTDGVGEQIRAALDQGARHILLALGGSATTDGGSGLLRALGLRWLDAQGESLAPGGAALAQLARIDASGLDPRLAHTRFTVACDVDNPLCGPHGAAAIFGPQKGASPDDVRQLDEALQHFAQQCAHHLGRDLQETPGAGAAGGVGFGVLSWLQAKLEPGAELVARACGLDAAIAQADLVLTGEGRVDGQTARGKTPLAVLRRAQDAGVPALLLAGQLGEGYDALYAHGLTAAFSLTNGTMTLADAQANAASLLEARTRDAVRLWLAGRAARH